MIAGIRKVVDLVEKINAAIGDQQIKVIDIHGGLPVNFDCDEFKPIFPGSWAIPASVGILKQPVCGEFLISRMIQCELQVLPCRC
jgi:hypothetical protein